MSRREFSKVSPAIWRSKRFLALADDRSRLLHLYLLTCQHQNSAGCFRLPDGYAIADLGWSIDEYRDARGKLIEAGLIAYDEQSEEVFIVGWFRVNPPCNPKHAAGIITRISDIESDDVRHVAEEEFTDINIAVGTATKQARSKSERAVG